MWLFHGRPLVRRRDMRETVRALDDGPPWHEYCMNYYSASSHEVQCAAQKNHPSYPRDLARNTKRQGRERVGESGIIE